MKRIASILILICILIVSLPVSGTTLYAEDVLANMQTVIPYATAEFVAWLIAQMASMGIEFDSLSDFNDRLQDSQFNTWIEGQWEIFEELDADGDGLYMPEDPLTYAIFGNNELSWYFAKYTISQWWEGVQLIFNPDAYYGLEACGTVRSYDGWNYAFINTGSWPTHAINAFNDNISSFAPYYHDNAGTYDYYMFGHKYTFEVVDTENDRIYKTYKDDVLEYSTNCGSSIYAGKKFYVFPYMSVRFGYDPTEGGEAWSLGFIGMNWNGSKYVNVTIHDEVNYYTSLSFTEATVSTVDESILDSEIPDVLLRDNELDILVQAQLIQDLIDALNGVTTVPATDVQVPSITNTYVSTTNDYVQATTNPWQITGELNLPKLPDLELPSIVLKDKFPFCIPFDLANALTMLSADPVAPEFDIPLKIERLGIDESFHLDLDEFEPIVNIMKWLILLAFSVSLIVATRKLIKG